MSTARKIMLRSGVLELNSEVQRLLTIDRAVESARARDEINESDCDGRVQLLTAVVSRTRDTPRQRLFAQSRT